VDGIGLLSPSPAAGRIPVTGPGSYREMLQQLLESLQRQNLTAILSHELSAVRESRVTSEVASYLVDTVIQLNRSPRNRQSLRSIEIVKSRGHGYESGQHTLRITEKKGLQVFRRVQAPRFVELEQPSSDKRSVIGNDVLDALIGGGIFDGSTTMVIGVSGVGKTVLGTQLLREGVMRQNQRGLLVSLDEHPAQIARNASTLGLNLQEQIDAGEIHILFESPQELDIDIHFAEIVEKVEKHNIQRLVIDGMTSYSTALQDTALYRDFFHALVAYSKSRLMTTFFNYENPEFLGLSTFMPDFPVSSIVDNIILLSLVEIHSSLRRCITVVKARGSKHAFDSREYEIGEGGIHLVALEEAHPVRVALDQYSSVLSRAPTRLRNPRQKPLTSNAGAE
jgi:circadian clock protein KaiC